MVHRSVVCPISDCGVHTYFTISLFLKYTCIFTQQAHDVDATSHRRQFDIGTTSCTYSLSPDIGGGGTIEMTLIRLCVRLSVILFVRPSVRQIFSRNFAYIFHRTDMKFYRLPSYHMKMCMWFLIFVSAIFDKVMALDDLYLVTSFIKLI